MSQDSFSTYRNYFFSLLLATSSLLTSCKEKEVTPFTPTNPPVAVEPTETFPPIPEPPAPKPAGDTLSGYQQVAIYIDGALFTVAADSNKVISFTSSNGQTQQGLRTRNRNENVKISFVNPANGNIKVNSSGFQEWTFKGNQADMGENPSVSDAKRPSASYVLVKDDVNKRIFYLFAHNAQTQFTIFSAEKTYSKPYSSEEYRKACQSNDQAIIDFRY